MDTTNKRDESITNANAPAVQDASQPEQQLPQTRRTFKVKTSVKSGASTFCARPK